jgi:16S rRNA U1498 N3-methylase RsmE
MERLQRIIIEAVEQSGRSCIPNFYFHDTLDFKTFQNHQNILLHHIDSCDAQKLKSLDFQYQK